MQLEFAHACLKLTEIAWLPVPGSSKDLEQDQYTDGSGSVYEKKKGFWGGTRPPCADRSGGVGFASLLFLVLFLLSVNL
jgi:hypothetical protein